ncbi:helix-turn-helix transcriptional regulator [Priestia aryabhattai]|uniref:helix-turn-helix domain-containing protein n=1 Tax=Priestia aryabhattai TaxID=412384 RepID=UPI002E1BDC46|nr:helix-turn-helix transcriptional regulator [Priestia aryabhattai]
MTDVLKWMDNMAEEHEVLKPTGNVISQSFSVLIFAFRLKSGLTQQELADKANVTVKTIHRAEGGSGGIVDKTYQKIFDALEITPQDMADALSKKSNAGERDLVHHY